MFWKVGRATADSVARSRHCRTAGIVCASSSRNHQTKTDPRISRRLGVCLATALLVVYLQAGNIPQARAVAAENWSGTVQFTMIGAGEYESSTSTTSGSGSWKLSESGQYDVKGVMSYTDPGAGASFSGFGAVQTSETAKATVTTTCDPDLQNPVSTDSGSSVEFGQMNDSPSGPSRSVFSLDIAPSSGEIYNYILTPGIDVGVDTTAKTSNVSTSCTGQTETHENTFPSFQMVPGMLHSDRSTLAGTFNRAAGRIQATLTRTIAAPSPYDGRQIFMFSVDVHRDTQNERDLQITNLVRDSLPRCVRRRVPPDCTRNDSTYFSIAPNGATNNRQRTFELQYQVSPEPTEPVEVDKVEVDLTATDGTVLQQIANEGETASGAVRRLGPNRLQVRVTNGASNPSRLAATGTSDRVRYRFTLHVRSADGWSDSATMDSDSLHPLWRTPLTKRFSTPDVGGDDWASTSTYAWVKQHQSLLNAVSDISGEHGKDIGHSRHETGDDIDEYHPRNFLPGSTLNGGENYRRLAEHLYRAVRGNARSQSEIRQWIIDTRSHVDAVLSTGGVEMVIYAKGCPIYERRMLPHADRAAWNAPFTLNEECFKFPERMKVVDEFWAESLIRTGSVSLPGGARFSSGLAAWSTSRDRRHIFQVDHNDHMHLALTKH